MQTVKLLAGLFVGLTVVFAASTMYLYAYPRVPVTTTTTQLVTFTSTVPAATMTSTISTTTTVTVSNAATTGAGPNGPYPKVVNVFIQNGAVTDQTEPGYYPDAITVVMGVNNTVTWTNLDQAGPHTVTFYTVPAGAQSINSGNMNLGASFTYTFTVAGTYLYTCSYHAWMKGTVIVK